MEPLRVIAVMLDGTKLEAVGVWAPVADRVAFERKFRIAYPTMHRRDRDGGALLKTDEYRDERMAFMAWRVLTRGGAEVSPDYDEFVDGCERLEVLGANEAEGDDEAKADPSLDPTVADPAPEPSSS